MIFCFLSGDIMKLDDSVRYRFMIFLGKSARTVWIIVLTIILVITVFYGIILNCFNSRGIAVIISIIFVGGVTFLGFVDVKHEKERLDSVSSGGKGKKGKVLRASSRKGV